MKPLSLIGLVVVSTTAFLRRSDQHSDVVDSVQHIVWAYSLGSAETSHWSLGHPGPYTFG